jgi:S1-C subfamily serine protease
MTESRFSLGQVLGVAVGVVLLVGVSALTGGAIGYQLGKADGQALAQAESRSAAQSASVPQAFPFGEFSLPQALPFEGEVPREFSAPQAYLGVRFEPIDEDLAETEKLSVKEGAIIREVIDDSPAARAGLQVGDVVTAVNGEAVDAEHTLRDRVAAHQPNDTIDLTVLRSGETLTISVTLGERKGFDVQGYQFRVPSDGSQPFFFGDPSNCAPLGEQG